jgi:hypothetical protein
MNIFPNRSTQLLFDYCERENINMNNDLSQVKKHISMMSIEAKKFHPFVGSCTKIVTDDIDWEFIKNLNE